MGAERGSRVLQIVLNPHYDRVRAAENAPRGPFCLLERRHGLAQIVERGGFLAERLRVNRPTPRRARGASARIDTLSRVEARTTPQPPRSRPRGADAGRSAPLS